MPDNPHAIKADEDGGVELSEGKSNPMQKA